jgi:acyl-CoA thioesterase-1
MKYFRSRKIRLFIPVILWVCLIAAAKPAATAEFLSGSAARSFSPQRAKNIVFFGNSITAGYGVDPDQAFPALIQGRIDSLRLLYHVVNAGLSGETSAGGRSRIDWILRQPVNIFVLELGGNDGLRGIPVSETSRNLQVILDKVRAKYPAAKLVLAGMRMPPSMGNEYVAAFHQVFERIGKEKGIYFIPFILDGVGGVPELNQADGIHPTPKGHRLVAETVWKFLRPLL